MVREVKYIFIVAFFLLQLTLNIADKIEKSKEEL